ncbi:SDR family NAD(P)-dependent oxidoreductase [Rhodococcus daqingensis]|uniref:SDR family NAD(P)-dependent oxidoreductase n=1 Tax=Rhodococcus daqingensis TaxID=2479363 RepID=A0ABW2RSL4_9NOCA
MRLEELAGQTAVVTGAGSGIGESVARRAAALGMNVVLADVAMDRIVAIEAQLRADGHRALAVPTDVSDADQVEALANAAYAEFGSVTILHNNAGLESLGYTWDVPADEWQRVLAVNVNGMHHGIRSFVPRMGADPRRSHIVNTCSVGGIAITPRMTAYAASKHAVQALTECLYLECAEAYPQIAVSVFSPGHVATRIFEDVSVRAEANDDVAFWRRSIQDTGITPDAAAEVLFNGLQRGEFWILTHREAFERLATKRAKVLTRQLRPDSVFEEAGRN